MRSFFSKLSIIGLSLFSFLLMGTANVQGQADNDFSRSFGLIVHELNEGRPVSRIKALEVLLKYFPEVDRKASVNVRFSDVPFDSKSFAYVSKACRLGLIDCSKATFRPHHVVAQNDFLDWFYQLKYFDQPNYLVDKYPLLKSSGLRAWIEARGLNLITNSHVTYKSLQDFFYRYEIVDKQYNQPYLEGLMADLDDLDAADFHNLKHIDSILNHFAAVERSYERQKGLSKSQKGYLKVVKSHIKAFEDLRESLVDEPYSIRVNPHLDDEVKDLIRKYGLQDKLDAYTYDYSSNKSYRQHNVTTGVAKMHARVYQPGDVLNYWDILKDRNLTDFQYGWVIANGTEQWQFGGGICGSSSIVFLPSWKAGLDIVQRKGHSKYYGDLYPSADIGLDATVYLPAPNLKIRNNTDSPIIYNVIDDPERKLITLEIYGNSPYRDIQIEGPIWLNSKHIKWVRQFEHFDGTIIRDPLETVYKQVLYLE